MPPLADYSRTVSLWTTAATDGGTPAGTSAEAFRGLSSARRRAVGLRKKSCRRQLTTSFSTITARARELLSGAGRALSQPNSLAAAPPGPSEEDLRLLLRFAASASNRH